MKKLTVLLLLFALLFASCTQTTPTTPTTTGAPTSGGESQTALTTAQQESTTQKETTTHKETTTRKETTTEPTTARKLPTELEIVYTSKNSSATSFFVRDPAVIRKLMDFRAGSFQNPTILYPGLCTHWVVYGEKDIVGLYDDMDYGNMGQKIETIGDEKILPKGMAAYVAALVEEHRRENPMPPPAEKPVIYLYPTRETDIRVKLDFDGTLDFCYPAYNNGWSVTAQPDGTLINHADGKEYSYLFWEGTSRTEYDFSRGFVVKGSDTAAFLQEKLAYMGLTPREYNEFIVYWLPQMQNNPYNLIAFQGEAYTESAKLEITPAPDSLLRIFMAFRPLEKPVDVETQVLTPFARQGFAVVEWGGANLGEISPFVG